jgi:catechol 2,3-dioxygenase-like lactoylglutathione lyase family enzyme
MRLHHPGIVVPDMDRALAFYRSLLDMRLVKESWLEQPSDIFDAITGLRDAVFRVCLLQGENFFIELFEFKEQSPGSEDLPASTPGIRHLCIQVPEVESALARLLDLGGTALGEVRTVPGGGTAVYCRDPFGNILEFTRPAGGFPPV